MYSRGKFIVQSPPLEIKKVSPIRLNFNSQIRSPIILCQTNWLLFSYQSSTSAVVIPAPAPPPFLPILEIRSQNLCSWYGAHHPASCSTSPCYVSYSLGLRGVNNQNIFGVYQMIYKDTLEYE